MVLVIILYKIFTNTNTCLLKEKWKLQEGQSVEVFDDISLLALDNLLQCVFSHESHCQTQR